MDIDILHYTILNAVDIILYLFYFSIFGIFYQNYFLNKKPHITDLVELNIYGLFFIYICLAIWNIFLPINQLFFLLVGLVFLPSIYIINRQELIALIKVFFSLRYIIVIILLLGSIFWISNLAMSDLKYEPMYYLQKVKWAQEYPLIKGLGNLFICYGLDSSHFLYLAFSDHFPFISRSFWNFNGYLLTLGFIYFFIMPVSKIFIQKKNSYTSDIMKLMFIPILIHNSFYMHPGLSTDLSIFIYGSILSIEIFRIFFDGEKNINIILICLFLGFSSKISFLPTTVLSIIVLFIFYFREIRVVIRKHKLTILLTILAFSLQIQRNIILTGYPLYPLEYISVPVKWKMDKDEVMNYSKDLSNWAKGIRKGETDLKEIEKVKKAWIKSRLIVQHRRIETLYPLALAIVGLIYILHRKRVIWGKLGIFLLPPIVQLFMWYFHAPDTRFSSFAFWWLGAGMINFAIKDLFPRKLLVLLPLSLVLFAFSLHTIDSLGSEKDLIVLEYSKNVPNDPKSFNYITNSGLMVLVPENGQKCDDCPLPCTMTPNPNLKLLESGEIESGFYLE